MRSRSRSRSKSPRDDIHKRHSHNHQMNYMELEEETQYSKKHSHHHHKHHKPTYMYDGRLPANALIKESLLLTDNEVTISFMKFMIGVAILNFPAESSWNGIFNGFISTATIVYLIAKSNENLVKAIPLELMNQNLTYG